MSLTLLALPATAGGRRCSATLKADGNTAAVQRAMEAGGRRVPVVCLRPGIYKGARLLATRSVVLRRVGRGKVVLDAGERGRVLTVIEPGIDVTLRGITLTHGHAEEGGALQLLRDAVVRLNDCWLSGNKATQRGGAIAVNAGKVVLVRTRITRNEAPQAGAIFLAPGARAVLAHSMVADNKNHGGDNAPLWISAGAGMQIVSSTVAYNHAHGVFLSPATGKARARLGVRDAIIMGGTHAIHVARAEAAGVEVFRSVLYGKVGFIPLDLHCTHDLPVFDLADAERYRPTAGSPAIALGRCDATWGRRDLTGRKRGKTCTAGALEARPRDIKKTLAARARQAKIKAAERKARGKDKAFDW